MTMAQGMASSRRALRGAMAALCVLSLTACSDSSRTENVVQIDPARMTQAQLLAALNAPGKEPQLGKRWRYALHDNCELEVSARNGGTDRRRLVLEGAQITARSLDGVSEVRLVPKIGGEAQAVTALASWSWFDMVMARSALTHLEVRCGNPVVPAA